MAEPNPQERNAIQDANNIIEKKKAIGIFLDRTSVLIGPFWNEFACYSGVEPAVVEAIDQDEIGVQSKADSLLTKMQEKQLDWSIVENILLRLDKYQVIRELRDKRDKIQNLGKIPFFKTSARLDVNLNYYEAVSIFLDKVATKIGGFWKNFGKCAGRDIEIIIADKGGAKKQAYKLLSEMRAESRENPLSWITIKEILSDMEKNDVIESLEIEITSLKEIYGQHPFFITDNDSITMQPIQDTKSNEDNDSITMQPIQDTKSNEDYLDLESCYLSPPEVRERPVVNPSEVENHVYAEIAEIAKIPVQIPKRKETAI